MLLLSPVEVEALGEHDRFQVFVLFLLPESLLFQESHQRVPLLHHLQHFVQDPLLLGQLCLSFQVVYKRDRISCTIFFPLGKQNTFLFAVSTQTSEDYVFFYCFVSYKMSLRTYSQANKNVMIINWFQKAKCHGVLRDP